MPELIRSAVSRVRVYFKDRRQSPRLRVRLLFTVSIHRPTNGNGHIKPRLSLKGHTRDLSWNGLALLVPQVHLDGHHLAADGSLLELRLELGSVEPISMLVLPHRYERLEETELGCGYLIGVKIVKLEGESKLRYESYVGEGLGQQDVR